MIRGTMAGMKPGTILGHEGVEAVGPQIRNLGPGNTSVLGSTVGCCSYCQVSYFAQCDNANPNGPQGGTAFGGSEEIVAEQLEYYNRKPRHFALAYRRPYGIVLLATNGGILTLSGS
jgi:threonine dehydrogenase-like Zn-dependent dehydrogenase